LLVDDDPDVHKATVFAVGAHQFSGHPVEFLHAYNSGEAKVIVMAEQRIAFILLDVVMETGTAGLELIDFIRQTAGLTRTRIVLRTGQPGYAPELETILRYDINDYKSKAELNQIKLLTLFTTTLRSYRQISSIENNKRGMAQIVKASADCTQAQDFSVFAQTVMKHLTELAGAHADTLVGFRHDPAASTHQVLVASGRFEKYVNQPLDSVEDADVKGRLLQAMESGQVQYQERDYIGLSLGQQQQPGMLVYVDVSALVTPLDAEIIGVFTAQLNASLRNLTLIEQLRLQAFVDELLGIPNRARLIAEIDELNSVQKEDAALALIDIDDFSAVNELMGHRYGDQLLKALALRFQQSLDSSVTLARVTGNAFGLLGPRHIVNPQYVKTVLDVPLVVDGRPHRVTVTTGLVLLEADFQSGADCLKNATVALKQAKRLARSGHVYYTADIGDMARTRAQMLADLHTAFDMGQLLLMYQPQIDLRDGALIGIEALMRWRRTDGTLVPPDQFIPVAEQSGLIVHLGDWALQVACKDMKLLIAQDMAPARVAVNISLEQFKKPDFDTSVINAIKYSGLDPNRLELEITESVAMLGLDHVMEQLNRLRSHGITVSIDDFGTGYSSLSQLERLPLDRIKIDKAFVRQIDAADNGRIARLIAELGETLGLRVLAEGIEDRRSWDVLIQMGCHEGQGFFIARPMELEPLIAWIAKYRKGLSL
jgi:diguanylate cyclase (GGDEF)-like protein